MNKQEAYTTIEAVYGYLGKEVPSESSEEATLVEKWILSMSRYIDNFCKRKIYSTEEVTTLYDGDGSNLLIINDVLDPVVKLNGSTINVLKYPTTKEYTSRIVLADGQRFSKGYQNVEVTGVHSMHLYLPEDIQLACTVLVAGIYNARNAQGKVGTTETIGDYAITYRDQAQKTDFETAKEVISSYKRITL